MGEFSLQLFREDPVEADLSGVVRQIQQPLSALQVPAKRVKRRPGHLDILCAGQHFIQLFIADISL